MRDVNEEVEPHRPITVETEAEADNAFILEELITKLTAKDPLANHLTQLNEYIGSMEKQLMLEETAPEEEYENVYAKLQEIENEFSKVMRNIKGSKEGSSRSKSSFSKVSLCPCRVPALVF